MPSEWRRPDGYIKLLIGGEGGRFPVLHFDRENANATITEIYGDKEFLLYPPHDGQYLYPKSGQPNHSQVDNHEDLRRFPLLARTTPFSTIVRPGDMIFVPCGWWHTARALGPSISVGMNLLDRSNWGGFVAEVCDQRDAASPARARFRRSYFRALGAFLNTLERFQERRPAFAKRLGFLGAIAPISSSVAADPGLSAGGIFASDR
jgi:hypothetical protein